MRPIITCEKPAFRQLIMGLTGISDTSFLPDSKVISKELKLRYMSYVTMLAKCISVQSFICTTADIWSCNNKSYLGMTCHFINERDFSRHSYVLGCKRIKGSHTYLNIAEVINKITKIFNINNSKISHCVTDNASNFCKAFRTFSIQPQANSSNSNSLINNWFCSDNDEYSSEENNLEVDDTCENVDVTELSTIFSSPNEFNSSDNEDEVCLPDHLTCSAHTLSLIATTDVIKIEDHSYKQISKSVFEKLYSFWNLVSRSSVASDNIFDICNCKFPVPIISRWNSLFFAVKKVLIHKDKLIDGFEELKLKKFKISEWKFLEEYCLVMEPLALALDKLQGEKSCFLGFVTPTIIALRLKLIQLTHLIYCKQLAHLLIVSLEKRFSYLFDLEHPKSKAFILASISHPKFKLSWAPVRYLSLCKKVFISECNVLNSIESTTSGANNSDDETDGSDSEFYQILNGITCFEESTELSRSVKSVNISSVQALSYLECKKKDLSILNNFPVVKNVFLKYNTTLPSSAPVERLFSSGIQILTPRRNRLHDKTFEMLLCCRCLNLKV